MAWYTDSAFRQLVKQIFPWVSLVTELVSADWLKYASKKTEEMIKHSVLEKPLTVQLFGKHPNFFVEAAKICEHYWATSIDINMWCPAKKVIHSGHWSSLIRSPDLAFEIVEKISKASKLPVSVKTRLGWDYSSCDCWICRWDHAKLWELKSDSSIDISKCSLTNSLTKFCKWLQDSGACQIVVHWRTVKQWYSWNANWLPIYLLKECLNIPVIWNWDIRTPQNALDKIQNLDWVFIWRACIWDPWIFKRVAQAFRWEIIDSFPDWNERKKWAIEHIKLNIESKWEKKWILEMRKHLATYVKALPEASQLRNKLVRVESGREAIWILEEV